MGKKTKEGWVFTFRFPKSLTDGSKVKIKVLAWPAAEFAASLALGWFAVSGSFCM
jgi:hypothetical protein